MSHCEHCRAQNGLVFLASATESARAHLNFTFCIQIPHRFHNKAILLQNKTKYGLVGTKGFSLNLYTNRMKYSLQKRNHRLEQKAHEAKISFCEKLLTQTKRGPPVAKFSCSVHVGLHSTDITIKHLEIYHNLYKSSIR